MTTAVAACICGGTLRELALKRLLFFPPPKYFALQEVNCPHNCQFWRKTEKNGLLKSYSGVLKKEHQREETGPFLVLKKKSRPKQTTITALKYRNQKTRKRTTEEQTSFISECTCWIQEA